MRIADLARRTGVSLRSIRFYHQLGILQRPLRRGRTGWYGPEHVSRLSLIRRLQGRGYSLAAIADLVRAQVPAVLAGAGELAGVDADSPPQGAAPTGAGADLVLDLDDVAQQVPDVQSDPALLAEIVDAGLLLPAGELAYRVPQPALWRAGVLLVSRGVPVRVALAELARLHADLGSIAQRLARVIERDVTPAPGGGAPGGGAPGDDVPADEAVTELLSDLWPAVLVAVGSVLTEETRQTMRARLADRAGRGGDARSS